MQNAFVLWYTAAAATATANVARWVIIVGKALIMLKAVYSRQDLQMADLIRGIILLECEIANVYYIHHFCILLYHSLYVLNFVMHCIRVHSLSHACIRFQMHWVYQMLLCPNKTTSAVSSNLNLKRTSLGHIPWMRKSASEHVYIFHRYVYMKAKLEPLSNFSTTVPRSGSLSEVTFKVAA